MTKEKIIEIVNACVQYNANQGTWSIDNRFADELLALMEQEKKEIAREILNDLKGLLEGYIHTEDNISLYEYYCKKYGVEL